MWIWLSSKYIATFRVKHLQSSCHPLSQLEIAWAHLDLGDWKDEDDEGEKNDEGDGNDNHECVETPALESAR